MYEEKSHRDELSEKAYRPHNHDNSGGSVGDEPKISDLTISAFRFKRQKELDKKAAASGRAIPAHAEAPILVEEAAASEGTCPAPVHTPHNTG